MAPVIQLEDEEIEEFAALAKSRDKLSEIVSISAKIGPKVGTFPMARRLSKVVGLDLSQLILAINGLVHVHGIKSGRDVTSEGAVEALVSSLEKANKPEVLSAWKEAKTEIVRALEALNEEHALVLSHEVGFVASSRPNVVFSMKLFTDTRSVFDAEGNRVLFTLIGHTLSLEYQEDYRRPREIHLSLDANDVASLIELCMQAEDQVAALKASISGPSGMPFEVDNE